MKIIFSNVNLRYRHIIKRIFDEAEEFTNNKVDNSYVSLAFVSEDEIKNLNFSFRKLDKVTDVLSFPMLDIKQGESTLADFESEREPDGRRPRCSRRCRWRRRPPRPSWPPRPSGPGRPRWPPR